MLIQIISHTPIWVWALLAVLLWVGFMQSVPRKVSWGRITVLPVAMTGLSLAGTVSAFGAGTPVLLSWGAGAAVSAAIVLGRKLPHATRYNAWTELFELPGSWTPLVLMMGIFATKYAAGVMLAMQPGLALDALFSQSVCALYGGFSGVFIARAARLSRLASAKADATGISQNA